MFTEKHAKEAILKLAELKGRERARLIERMLRQETGHFKSRQYKICGSAGMEYGKWAYLDEDKFTKVVMNDNHPEKVKVKQRVFIKWNSVLDFCLYLSDYIDRHDGNYARWNSVLQTKQKLYRRSVESVTPRFIK